MADEPALQPIFSSAFISKKTGQIIPEARKRRKEKAAREKATPQPEGGSEPEDRGEDTCLFCHKEVGYFGHMVWKCPARPPPVEPPQDRWLRRLGWPTRKPRSTATRSRPWWTGGPTWSLHR